MKANKCGVLLAMLLLAVQASADSAQSFLFRTPGMFQLLIMIFLFALFICSAHIGKRSRILLSLYLLASVLYSGYSTHIHSTDKSLWHSLEGFTSILILGLLAVLLGASLKPRIKKITSKYTENRLHRMIFLMILALLSLFSAIILLILPLVLYW